MSTLTSNLAAAYYNLRVKLSKSELTMWLISTVGIVCIFVVFGASIPDKTSLDAELINTTKNASLTTPVNQNMFDIMLEEVADDDDTLFPDSFRNSTEAGNHGDLDDSAVGIVDEVKPQLPAVIQGNSTEAAPADNLPQITSEANVDDAHHQTSAPVLVSSTVAPNPDMGHIIPSATIAELPSLVEDFEGMFDPAQFTEQLIPTGVPLMTQPIMAVSMTPTASATEPPTTTVKVMHPVIPTRIPITVQPMITPPAASLPVTAVSPITTSEATTPATTEALTTAESPTTTEVPVTEEAPITESITFPEPSITEPSTTTEVFITEEHSTESTITPTTNPPTITEASTMEERPTPTESTNVSSADPSTTTEAFTTEEEENTDSFMDRQLPIDDITMTPVTEVSTTTTQASTTSEIPAATLETTTEIPTTTSHRTTTNEILPTTMQVPTTEPITESTTSVTTEHGIDDITKPVTVWAFDESKTTTAKPRLSRPWILKPLREPPTTERVFIIHAVPSQVPPLVPKNKISATDATSPPKVASQHKNTTSAHNTTVPLEALSLAQKAAVRKFLDAKRHNTSVVVKASTPTPIIRHTTLIPQVSVTNPGSGFVNPVMATPSQQQVPAFFPQARPVFPFTNFQTFPNQFPNQQPVMPFQPVQTNFLSNPVNAPNSFFPGR